MKCWTNCPIPHVHMQYRSILICINTGLSFVPENLEMRWGTYHFHLPYCHLTNMPLYHKISILGFNDSVTKFVQDAFFIPQYLQNFLLCFLLSFWQFKTVYILSILFINYISWWKTVSTITLLVADPTCSLHPFLAYSMWQFSLVFSNNFWVLRSAETFEHSIMTLGCSVISSSLIDMLQF